MREAARLVDTSVFYARSDEDDAHHEDATRLFHVTRDDDIPYRPLYTSQAIVAEFATLTLYKLIYGYSTVNLRTTTQEEIPTRASQVASIQDQLD